MARVYNFLLGGKDNFAADREMAARLCEVDPGIPRYVRSNRLFILAAVRRAARAGIGQFIDLGAGLPAHPAVHDAARAVIPDARVVYVDDDPVACAHSRALLTKPEGLAVAEQDLTDPDAVLADQGLRSVINLGEPCGVILAYVVHFLPADTVRQVISRYRDAVAPGSWVIVSAGHGEDPQRQEERQQAYTAGAFINHSLADFASFFAGLELVPPGIADTRAWAATAPEANPQIGGESAGSEAWVMCGAGVKSPATEVPPSASA